MHRARVLNEVQARPRIAREELGGEQIAFQAITARAGQHDVAGNVRATVRERMDVIERREIKLQRSSAVDAPSAAVAHGGALDCPLLVPGVDLLCSPGLARDARKGNPVNVPPL